MGKIENYKEFKKYEPQYHEWKIKRDENIQKKVNYLKTNPIPDDEYNKQIERAKVVLNAVNVMDEYSQSRAEDTEQVIQTTSTGIMQVVSYISMGLAGVCIALSKGAQNALKDLNIGNFKNIAKLIPAGLAFILPTAIISSIISSWGASKQVQASRLGRKDAMDNDLASLNQFAVLTKEQEKELENISKTIKVDKKDSRKVINSTKGLGLAESFKTIFTKDDKDIIKTDVKLDTRADLSNEEILNAKKDKELIQNIVEKIDISSQDYAENAELAVGTIQAVATASGLGLGAGLKSIFAKIKPLAKYSKPIGLITTMGLFFAGVILSAKIDKQASRVGRFKAKQELLNNPQQLIYVDEDKYKNEKTEAKKPKKANYFSQVIQMLKDNVEYNKYLKENNVAEIQKRKAKEQIKLTDKQKDEALQLQKNVFNMFNKLDEKSQTYSESTEALGETITNILTSIISLPIMMISSFAAMGSKTKKGKIVGYLAMLSSLIIPIASNIIVTKEQKKASRVANMEAIKELDDYRYFTSEKTTDDNKTKETKTPSVISPMLKKKINSST